MKGNKNCPTCKGKGWYSLDMMGEQIFQCHEDWEACAGGDSPDIEEDEEVRDGKESS